MTLLIRKPETASKIKRGLRVAPSGISVFDARKVCTDIVNVNGMRTIKEEIGLHTCCGNKGVMA